MIIGIPKEIKKGEYRVSVTPGNVKILTKNKHKVLVEAGAGRAGGFDEEEYKAAGANIICSVSKLWSEAEMIVKVKEILPQEFGYLRENHIIMTYIHSANRLAQTKALLDSKVVAFAYEDVMDEEGGFPLLAPMSEIAGSVGLLTGVIHLFNTNGGEGRLVCGAPGVSNVKIVIFGGGNVGLSAAKLAVGLGADVTIMDNDIDKLRKISAYRLPKAKTVFSNNANVIEEIAHADLVINAVKWVPGLTIISRDMLKYMKPNSLIVDIDAEPGGAIETSRYSTHDDPIYTVDGIRHIGIPNLPGAVANTASIALSNATIPYIAEVADKGWIRAAKENKRLICGLGFVKGLLTFRPTADAFDLQYIDAMEAISAVE